jgi:DNA mismatch endonuclease (patch repair protein)
MNKPEPSSEHASATMRANRSTDTGPELRLRSILHQRGLRFRKNYAPVPGYRCRVDIVFPVSRLAVFVDGCWWHHCPVHGEVPKANYDFWLAKFDDNRQRDARNSEALRAEGWLVLRFWEHEDLREMADQVEAIVRNHKGVIPSVEEVMMPRHGHPEGD